MIVQEWIVVFQQVTNCYVPTLIILFLVFFAWMAFVWTTAVLTPSQKMPFSAVAQIAFCVLACIGCGLTAIGFLVSAEHTESVVEALRLMDLLNTFSSWVQVALLWVLKKMA